MSDDPSEVVISDQDIATAKSHIKDAIESVIKAKGHISGMDWLDEGRHTICVEIERDGEYIDSDEATLVIYSDRTFEIVDEEGDYVVRIYKEDYSFDCYDDTIYRLPESEVDKKTILKEIVCSDKTDLLRKWAKKLEEYEGFTYCVKDLARDEIIVGGVYDPSDDEIIEEYDFREEKI